jgi:uroporphyrinogen decarboxylase
MNKRERLERTLAGEAVDRVPVALWRPFPGDDQRAHDFAQCVLDFQQRYDWDFVNVCPSPNYAVIDHGVQDEWQGEPGGERVYLKRPVRRSLDWTELRALDPGRGELGKQIMGLRLIQDGLRDHDVPLIMTVYSPLTQAARIVGKDSLLRHLRTQTERLITGLNVLTESTMRFVDALKLIGIAGIYYVIEHADYDMLSEDEYETFGLPYDNKVLEALPETWWLNTVYLQGQAPMMRFAGHYRVQIWNRSELAGGKTIFDGAACGGLDAKSHLLQGTPAVIRSTAREAMSEMSNRRLILSTGGTVSAVTPLSNLRTVREVVEGITV